MAVIFQKVVLRFTKNSRGIKIAKVLQNLIGKIWRKLPRNVRLFIIRASQKKFIVSVGAVVLDKDGRILLLDHVIRPGSGWGIPGGFINHAEQAEAAIRREIREETGLMLEEVSLAWVKTRRKHVEVIFRAEARGEAAVKSREIKEARWFYPGELPAGLPDSQREIIERALKIKP
jgi:8-oxo-dGTP diphosphatase